MRARELKQERARLGLWQAALSKAPDLHRQTITRYEIGEDPIHRIVGLAHEALQARQQAVSSPKRPASSPA